MPSLKKNPKATRKRRKEYKCVQLRKTPLLKLDRCPLTRSKLTQKQEIMYTFDLT